ncbi:MAG TPA: hypothetical protein VJN19_03060, partial [Propionibacteriaceae bacterium]|nr:hypothetical protein [Propionibacteriaceae bacterium]
MERTCTFVSALGPEEAWHLSGLPPNPREAQVWQSGAVPVTNRIPAVWLVVTGIVSVQVGAAIAK